MEEEIKAQESIGIWEILQKSLLLYKENFFLFIGIVVLGNALVLLRELSVMLPMMADKKWLTVILQPIDFLISFWAGIALIIAVSRRYLNNRITLRECFVAVKGKCWRLLDANIRYFLVLIGGSLLLIIPGIYWAIVFSLIGVIVILEERKDIGPFRMSKELIKGFFWKIFFLGLIILVLCSPFYFIYYKLVKINQNLSNILYSLFGIISTPFFVGISVILYYRLKERKKNQLPLVLEVPSRSAWYYALRSIALLVTVGGLVFAVIYWFLLRSPFKMPAELKKPGIFIGPDFLSKKILFQDKRLGKITDIVLGELDLAAGEEIGIASSKGALFIDKNSTVKSSVVFSGPAEHVDIIDVEGDGVCEFINRGSWYVDASLIDHNGKTVWSYGKKSGVNDMCAGDLDKDGIKEFVVSFNASKGVHLLDKGGKNLWEQPDKNVWCVEMADSDSDGNLEIVHSNAGGQIRVRDSKGRILNQPSPSGVCPLFYFDYFSVIKWPSRNGREYVLLSDNDTILILDFDARIAAQFKALKCGSDGFARGLLVRLEGNQSEYLAVIVEYEIWEKSILYLYTLDGKLVYQEILPEACGAIAAIALDGSEAEAILIGGKGKVWQYKLSNITTNYLPLKNRKLGTVMNSKGKVSPEPSLEKQTD